LEISDFWFISGGSFLSQCKVEGVSKVYQRCIEGERELSHSGTCIESKQDDISISGFGIGSVVVFGFGAAKIRQIFALYE